MTWRLKQMNQALHLFKFALRPTRHRRFFQSQRFIQHNNNHQPKSVSRLPILRVGFLIAGVAGIAYDGIVNEFTYCGASVRFVRSLKTASLIGIDYLLLDESDKDYATKLKALHKKSAERLLDTCLLNGGLYIKVGQGFAAINHILPIEYTSTLSKLQDSCLPTSKDDVQKLFLKDFGQLPEDIYEEFDYKPVAAASLAQVFKAKLASGESVAVKVQYNDLQKRFISDLSTIIFLQDIVEFVFKDYNFGWIVNDLRKNLIQELNFVQEAQNAERCANDMKIFDYVYVPKVYWHYTKKRVLTLEWMDGCKISDLVSIASQKLSLRDIDVKLFNMFAEQIFHTGFVHADPHPGNIFVRKSLRNGKQADIILLDHGLYEELPADVRKPLCEFWEATVLRDESKMECAANKIGIRDYMKFAEVLFQQPIRIRGGRICSKLSQEDIEYIQLVARQNFDAIMSTLKEMPRSMLFVVRNLNTVRAISHQHGDVVDRPRVMAHYAQRCLYARHSHSPREYMHWLYRRIYFGYCLWINAFKLKLLNWYFNLLYLIGRAPASAKTVLHDVLELPIS